MIDTDTNDKLSQAFINGLKEMGLDYWDVKQNWKYYGGNKDHHLNYYRLITDDPLPEHEKKCVCKHTIKENCYISNPDETELIVIGNCCIKKFIDKKGRTCSNCKHPHNNRKDNLCNTCRKAKRCRGCKQILTPNFQYHFCSYKCFQKHKN
jgi:hypothetical protein